MQVEEVFHKIQEARDAAAKLGPSRELSSALTKLDEARLWLAEDKIQKDSRINPGMNEGN